MSRPEPILPVGLVLAAMAVGMGAGAVIIALIQLVRLAWP